MARAGSEGCEGLNPRGILENTQASRLPGPHLAGAVVHPGCRVQRFYGLLEDITNNCYGGIAAACLVTLNSVSQSENTKYLATPYLKTHGGVRSYLVNQHRYIVQMYFHGVFAFL